MIILLLIVLGVAFYITTPEERARFFRAVLAVLPSIQQVKDAANRVREERDPFSEALRARTSRALVTPALVAVNATVFVFMLISPGAFSDPETLLRWGGSFGPRTTNGEWWRLVTATFVHSGMLHLLVNVAGLVQIGLILERLVGHLTFAAVYIAAGAFASLVGVSMYPLTVSVGASGAIFGIYGLLLASMIWSMLHRSPPEPLSLREPLEPLEPSEPLEPRPVTVSIPLTAWKRLGPAVAVFILYNVATNSVAREAELVGLAVGFVSGLFLTRGVSEYKPPLGRVAAAMGAAVVIAVACAVPLRGIADVRPEMERVVAIEDQTAVAYEKAVVQFRKGHMTAKALAQLIDRTIMPELQAASARIKALEGVPAEHQPLVASAEEYLRLRDESWRLRAEGLNTRSLLTLQKAERPERAALEALQRIRPADRK